MSQRLVLTACLLWLGLPAAVASTPSPDTQHAAPHLIAMQMVGKHPRVQVRIDGVDRPLSFVVDTAASVSVLDSTLADALDLLQAAPRQMQVQGAGGSAAPMGVTHTLDLAADGFRWKAQLLAMDLSAIAVDGAPAIEGILGNDLMARFDVGFDLPAERLTLASPGTVPRLGCLDNALPQRNPALQRFAFAPAQLEDGAHQVPAIAVVDTGAAQTVLNPSAARALGVYDDPARLRPREGGTRGISEQVTDTWLYALPSLQIDAMQMAPAEVRVSDLPVFATLGLGEQPALILGIDALRHRRMDVLANGAGICLRAGELVDTARARTP
ncbi:pepsin/retropepsin-like aspartic protease family protein [Luteimonas sp. 3794]|uniref:pepsin/retropepsin-like aspartic protease family protein n=1 Tax=Luteimonas sp. 3794 TaxID=2817730 RepID=UPI0028583AB3|nr:pepsin/retropepsin-like aspartic protease family protein [Luteimonas sp. 3794]MDR6990362.1 hypothetical protein [Luteimonas sp. 3794]